MAIAASSPRSVTPAGHRGDGLERLQRRAREDGRGRVAEAAQHGAVGASTTAEPACRDSTKPLRSTTASSTASVVRGRSGRARGAGWRAAGISHDGFSLSRAPRPEGGSHGARTPLRRPRQWQGNRGTGTSGYRDYGRQHEVERGGQTRRSRVRPTARSTATGTRWNPEEMLLAALSQCHMLSYLHVAVRHGVVVLDYSDDAVGTMVSDASGAGRFTSATLRPRVLVADAAQIARELPARRGLPALLHRQLGELPGRPRARSRRCGRSDRFGHMPRPSSPPRTALAQTVAHGRVWRHLERLASLTSRCRSAMAGRRDRRAGRAGGEGAARVAQRGRAARRAATAGSGARGQPRTRAVHEGQAPKNAGNGTALRIAEPLRVEQPEVQVAVGRAARRPRRPGRRSRRRLGWYGV